MKIRTIFTILNARAESATRAEFLGISRDFLALFEDAIDDLRVGNIITYNIKARRMGFAEIKVEPLFLPMLKNSDYLTNLVFYELLAELQEEFENGVVA